MTTAYGSTAIVHEVNKVERANAGTRNTTLNSAAFKLGQLIPSGHVDEDEVIDKLTDAAYCAYYTASAVWVPAEGEMKATIYSGLTAGKTHPRHPSNPYTSRVDGLEAVHAIAQHVPIYWGGQPKEKRTLKALQAALVIAHQQGGISNLPLSVTRVRITGGLSGTGQTHRALRELVDMGWLSITRRGGPGYSTRYHLHLPQPLQEHLHHSQEQALQDQSERSSTDPRPNAETGPTCGEKEVCVNGKPPPLPTPSGRERSVDAQLVGHDALRRDALDLTGYAIAAHLMTQPDNWHTQASVARAVGVCSSTVNRHVRDHRALIATGIVERDERGRLKATSQLDPATLDHVAGLRGTLGRRDRDRRRTAEWYQHEGFMDRNLRWITQATGEVGNIATWLLPDRP